MKRSVIFLCLSLFFTSIAFAQAENPVTWAYYAKKVNATEAVVYIRATIDNGWHIYSQNIKPGGPNKTIISFSPSKDFALVGKTAEPKPIIYFDKNFKMDVGYFTNEVVFNQKIKLNKNVTVVKGTIDFSVCDDKHCLPPDDVTFSIPVK